MIWAYGVAARMGQAKTYPKSPGELWGDKSKPSEMNDELLVKMAKQLEAAQRFEKIADDADKKKPAKRRRSKTILRKE